MEKTTEGWSSGICECSEDWSIFLTSLFCCPCQLAKNRAISKDEPLSVTSCLSVWLCTCCEYPIYYSTMTRIDFAPKTRGVIRKRYGIHGSLQTDCIAICCCPWCAVAQETRELKLHGYQVMPITMHE
ncbi:hypothetical protein PROFUN_00250 [Planoprotostelium fungivorum]|uniref:PLAC8 family protein n=1 Tax=Planoprotostelium fungivorum TaxID=1890364 RepID=A0A2P6NXW3_9EUKA|nr:hypothetical protein PROFUN_00250 [Planoprotostelium fungivorum]